MDEKLNWENNTTHLVKKSYIKLRDFYKHGKVLSSKTKTRLAETYVLSQLNYCNIVTQAMTAAQKLRIQRVQNSCVRYIFGLKKYDHITPYLKRLDTLNMEDRVKSHSLTMMHKTVNNIAPTYLSDKLTFRHNIHNHETRNRNTLIKHKTPALRGTTTH